MLPPQLQHGLRRHSISLATAAAALRPSTTSSIVRATQSRSCWWGRPRDYPSRVDPMFHRFARYRTLKTRAKLLDKLRRRGRWDWDANQRPFFSPKHVRLASHIGRPRWKMYGNEDGKEKTAEEILEQEGFELSQREKEWKDQMEAMRKRIDQDPYEAIFGRRFEPFWNGLVPGWMRNEMGPNDGPKSKDPNRDTTTSRSTPAKPVSSESKLKSDPVKPVDRTAAERSTNDPESDGETPNGQLTSYTYIPKRTVVNSDPECPNGQLTNYSYASSTSTSWDSWTKKTRRTEWDSMSGKTRRYEYDPISNRMVEMAQPKAGEARSAQASEAAKQDPMFAAESKSKQPAIKSDRAAGSSRSEAVDIPVKPSSESRKSIPIPTQTLETTSKAKTSVYFPSLINTSVVSKVTKPEALTAKSEKQLEKLTADDVRASVGKARKERDAATQSQRSDEETRAHRYGRMDPKQSQWDQAETDVMLQEGWSKRGRELREQSRSKPKLETALDRKVNTTTAGPPRGEPAVKSAITGSLQSSLERMQSKTLPAAVELDDLAAHESTGDRVHNSATNIPKQWEKQADMLQADRIKRTRGGCDEATPAIDSLTQKLTLHLDKLKEKHSTDKPRWVIRGQGHVSSNSQRTQTTGTELINLGNKKRLEMVRREVESLAGTDPKLAELVKELDAREAARKTKLAKANAMLETEVEEQRTRMQAHEGRTAHVPSSMPQINSQSSSRDAPGFQTERERYQQKIRDLRKELDTAFKQSSVQAEMQVDRIKDLKKAAENLPREVTEFQVERERYQHKIGDLRKELDTAFKQSSVNAEMQVERIRDLEKAMEDLRKSSITDVKFEEVRFQQKINVLKAEIDRAYMPYVTKSEMQAAHIRELEAQLREARAGPQETAKGAEISQAEGDFCANVTKYAKDNSKWYKKPCRNPEATGKPTQEEIDVAAKKVQDQNLTNEVQNIYERKYGTIDVNHRQPIEASSKLPRMSKPEAQVVEVESDVDLGKALADYEKDQTYDYKRDNLEAEIAAEEREAHEAQALMAPESSSKMKQAIANNLNRKEGVHGARIVDDNLPKLIPTEIAGQKEKEAAVSEWGFQWDEPPAYKVLAYDSGNDIIKTAVTSSNFTNKETPITIQEALSELYQPARFVPHFAGLQKEGYQVIYGTKDLLVFRKVRQAPEAAIAKSEDAESLQDHGLFKSADENPPANYAGVNPIDGTSHPVEPSTGSFASPTGFVGDRWFSEGQAQSPSTVANMSKLERQPAEEATEDLEFKHYPRVKREERVYSGSRLQKQQAKQRKSHSAHEQRRSDGAREESAGAGWKRVALSAATMGGVCYAVGAAVERKEEREKERWEQILEGRNLK
ncbi:Hypothetical predicted protein [Lecanosticta acicola]|uniref:Uncharacterized protein n=1 Tax=Lecanosticta acicola TaxID=111012 RepID=A0AAI8Z6K0_9PEZI|nr:Hypothetical predicted protein [Lecanosticta acicola]